MISTILQGGLGNQMFQIAAGHALALNQGVQSCFNLSDCYTPQQGNPSLKYKNNIFSKVTDINVQYWRPIYNEPKFSFSKLPSTKNLILNGYFQSEKYFKNYKNEIVNLFDLSDKINVNDYLKMFKTSQLPITCIHVRRGDYLNNPNYHPVCDIEYYTKAMNIIGDSNFIFISDDISWVKDHFKGDNIWYSIFSDELDDLKLMTICDNIIISNSSFSWWGAYLNRKINKKIIAPKKWFGVNGPQDVQDLIPLDWLTI